MHLLVSVFVILLAVPPAGPGPIQKSDVERAVDRGTHFLIEGQRPDGSYGSQFGSVGITGLVVHALATCHRAYREDDGPFISEAVKYMLANVQEDGGIYNAGQGLWNYNTSVSIVALVALDKDRSLKRYADVVSRARDFIVSLQASDKSKPLPYDPEVHKRASGGIGYGSDRRPDLSNTQWALEALHESGLSEDSDVWKNALRFMERCQNRDASNDTFDEKTRSTEDGGFIYAPLDSKAPKITNADGTVSYSSYGSMTYAGLKSYVYAGLSKDDPRVKAAWDWIQKNYTVEVNPGMATSEFPERGQMGLFYYYSVMARTLDILGRDVVETPDGKKHRWAEELAMKLLSLQRPDGSWVNPTSRWMEADPVVVTSYAVRILSICAKHMEE